MSYEEVFGFTFIAFIAICGFFLNVKKSLKEEKKPLDDLNNNIIRLNTNFENMLESDKIRDQRITKHGLELEKVSEDVHETKIKLDNVARIADKHDLILKELDKKAAVNTERIDRLEKGV